MSLKKGYLRFHFIWVILFLFLNPISLFAQNLLEFRIEGLEDAPKKNALLRLEALTTGNLSTSTILGIYRRSPTEIKKGIEPYGYFRSKVYSTLFRENEKWIAHFLVDKGEPLRITDLSIRVSGPGSCEPPIREYINNPALKVGDVFDVPRYQSFKSKLFAIAKDVGYLRAFFQNRILVDLALYTCKISIHLITGQQYYFGPFTFKNFPYSKRFLCRFLSLKQGQVFSSSRILDLQRRMEKSYYFDRVVFKPVFNKIQNRQVPVDIYLTPPKSQHYTFGIGYGTLTGPRISAGMSLRRIGHEGHHLESELKLSQILAGAAITYYIPGCDPLTEEWLTGMNFKSFHPKAGRSNSVTLSAGYSKEFDNAETILTLNYLFDRFDIRRIQSPRSSHEFYPSAKLSYVKADNLASPKNAHLMNLTLQAAAKEIFSTTSFASLQSRVKWFFSPFDFSRVILRGDLGLAAVQNLPAYPLSLRFFAGGMNSIRGFSESGIGPGRYLLVGSAEYQHKIKGNLFAAVFYDAGLAANSFHAEKGRVRGRSIGLGAVYYTKVGPIKLYVAQAVSKKTRPKSIEFSVGPEFS